MGVNIYNVSLKKKTIDINEPKNKVKKGGKVRRLLEFERKRRLFKLYMVLKK